MAEMINLAVQTSLKRLFPGRSLEEVLTTLLLERAQRELIKYQSQVRHFQAKYNRDFATFREKILSSDPDPETEQDYFDWELAETRCEEMRAEIAQLQATKATFE